MKKIWQQLERVGRRFPEAMGMLALFLVTGFGLLVQVSLGVKGSDFNQPVAFTGLWWLKQFNSWAGAGVLAGAGWRWWLEEQRGRLAKFLTRFGGWLSVGLVWLMTLGWTSSGSSYQWLWFLVLFWGAVYLGLQGRSAGAESKLVVRVGQQTVFSGMIGVAICVGCGMALTLWSLLFDWVFEDVAVAFILLLALGVATTYFFATFPEKQEDLSQWVIPKVWQLLGFYLAGGFLLLYEVILYFYLGYGLLFGTWAEVSLVNIGLWFCAAALVWVFISRAWLRPKPQGWPRWGRRIFLVSLLPILSLVAAGLVWRVSDYGWTGNRLLTTLLLAWVAGGVVYLSVKETAKKSNLVGALALVLLIGGGGATLIQGEIASKLPTSLDSDFHLISFHLPEVNLAVSLNEQQVLLSTTESEAGEAGEATIATTRGQLSYWWPAETQGGAVGELAVKLNGQEVYRTQVKDRISAANRQCQQQKDPDDNQHLYGCTAYDILSSNPRQNSLTWQEENQWLKLTFVLTNWYGRYDPVTGEQTLDSLKGWVVVELK